jgi:nitrous oxidase accessory protein
MWRKLTPVVFVLAILFVGIQSVAGRPISSSPGIPAEELALTISAAAPGDTITVDGGVFYGALNIDKPLTIIGINRPVIDGQEQGTVVRITGAGSTISGFTIRHSGSSLDMENSGMAVEARGVTVENNIFEDTLFGIYLREAHQSIVRDNQINNKALELPRRGDGIRVWSSNDVLIEGNTVKNGRDVVLWYSERLTVQDNDVQNGRYGLHFMYCDDAHIKQNRLINNSVGAFLMYSRRMTMQQNTVAHNRGPSGYGIGMKDMDDAVVENNVFLDNRIGAYLDGSPREVDSTGRFTGNVFAYNDVGVQMLPAVRHNEFSANSFVENEEQMAIAGRGTPGENVWTVGNTGNYWSDYAGFDADQDGIGDIAYRSERLFENLMQQEPNLRLFRYSPVVNALDFAATAFPLVRPQPKLVDGQPLTAPRLPAGTPPLPQPAGYTWYWVTPLLLILSLALIALPRRHSHYYQFERTAVRKGTIQ